MNDEKAKRKITTNKKSKNNHLKDTTHNFFALRETLKKNGTNPIKRAQNANKSTRTAFFYVDITIRAVIYSF